MTAPDDLPPPPPRPPACERARTLMGLVADGDASGRTASPDVESELARHVDACVCCAAAARADRAVRDRLRARAAGAVPAGFTAATVAAAVAARARDLAESRFLRRVAAAAGIAAAGGVGLLSWRGNDARGFESPSRGPSSTSGAASDVARAAVVRPGFPLPR